MLIVGGRGTSLLGSEVSTESLGGYVVIWEISPVSPGVYKSYMVRFLIICEMLEVKFISKFL